MDIQFIDNDLLNKVSVQAQSHPRLRMNHNFHKDLNDPVNRMLNALEPNTYIRPHRHLSPPKTESYIVLKGALDVLIFDDSGALTFRKELNPLRGQFGVEIPPHVWHGIIVKETNTVIYEVKTGPFTPILSGDFANWAPEADDCVGIDLFFKKYA